MSRGTGGGRDGGDVSARNAPPRVQRGGRGLRVIEGGRGKGGAPSAGKVNAGTGRREPQARVKRRRRFALAVLLVLAAGLITYVLLGPVTRMIESRRNLARAEAQLAEEQSRTQALQGRMAWGMTERFVEQEARKIGFVKPGEIPIVVLDCREEEPAPAEEAGTPSP